MAFGVHQIYHVRSQTFFRGGQNFSSRGPGGGDKNIQCA